jgi:hypothetical protein
MKRITLALIVVALSTPLHSADPNVVVVWRAKDLAALETKIKGNVDPARHLGLERLLDSGTPRSTSGWRTSSASAPARAP